jgi:hypothetical protein
MFYLASTVPTTSYTFVDNSPGFGLQILCVLNTE